MIKMKKLFDFYQVARGLENSKIGIFIPRRGVRYNEALKWVRPERKPVYDPACTGDLAPMTKVNSNSLYLNFKHSKELETADDTVKKIFSIGKQTRKTTLKMYEAELMEKVRNHPYDYRSLEVLIAKLTAKIRFTQEIIMERPSKHPMQRIFISRAIDKRKKLLKYLRLKDYKKFEWLLDTLELEYKPIPVPNPPVTRKKSLTLLAKLKVEELKEQKLAELKKSYDKQKVPFLEKKLEKLKDIKAKQEKYNIPVTVTDEDIKKCIQQLEEVKIQVAEREKRGYVRKIHPYFLEPYHEDLLLEKEKAGGAIREKLINNKETESS